MSQMGKVSGSVKWRDQTIINLLGKLQRERDLEPDESALLERTVRRLTPRRAVWRWSEKEDRLLKALIRRWPKVKQQRPYQPNGEVRRVAAELGRTPFAIYRRMERLRKNGKCSGAKRKAKG